MRKQQGSARRLRLRGSKGSVMSGNDSAFSKLHRHLKKLYRHRM